MQHPHYHRFDECLKPIDRWTDEVDVPRPWARGGVAAGLRLSGGETVG